jgi:hypothetical protein
LAGKARASFLWCLAFFALAHVGLVIATQGRWQELRDPEFHYKLAGLRQVQASDPDRPLVVLLGSSRTGQGLRPAVIPPLRTRDGRTPYVYNFSQVGSGPQAELMTLRRLLDDGVRPDFLACEILPPLLGRKFDACGNPKVGVSRLTWSDVSLLRHYSPEPAALLREWVECQLTPWYANRFSLLNQYAADFLPWRLRMDSWKAIDAWGWSDLGVDTPNPVKNPRALQVAHDTYFEELQRFRVSPMQDRALRDLLGLCHQEGIPVVLYLMPEGRIFQSWYPPAVRADIDRYLTGISQEYGVSVVDPRNWIEDEYFFDNHHLDRRGAIAYTLRFAREVLAHLVNGEPNAISCVLVPLKGTYPREQTPLLEAQARPAKSSPPMLSINGGPRAANDKRQNASGSSPQ